MKKLITIVTIVLTIAAIACTGAQNKNDDRMDTASIALDSMPQPYQTPDSAIMPLDSVSTTGKSGNR